MAASLTPHTLAGGRSLSGNPPSSRASPVGHQAALGRASQLHRCATKDDVPRKVKKVDLWERLRAGANGLVPGNFTETKLSTVTSSDPAVDILAKSAPLQTSASSSKESKAAAIAAELATALQAAEAEKEQLQQQLAASTQASSGLHDKLEELQQQLASVRDQSAVLSERNDMLSTSLSMLEAKASRLEKDLERAEAARESAVAQRNTLLAERDALQAQLVQIREAAQAARQQAASNGGDVRQQLQSTLDELSVSNSVAGVLVSLRTTLDELAKSQSEAAGLRVQVSELRSALAEVQAQKRTLEETLSKREQHDAAPSTSLQAKVSELQEELQTALQGHSQLLAESDKLSKSQYALALKNRTLQEQVASLNAQLAARDKAIKELQGNMSKVSELQEELQTALQGHSQLLAESDKLSKSQYALALKNRTLQDQVTSLTTTLAAKEATIQQLQQQPKPVQLDESKQALLQAQSRIQQLELEHDQAVSELALARQGQAGTLAEISAKAARLETELKTLRERSAMVEHNIVIAEAALKRQREESRAREAQLSQQIAAVRQELESTRELLHIRNVSTLAIRRGVPPQEVQFTNTNRYWVPQALVFEFMKGLAKREVVLTDANGYLGMAVNTESPEVYAVSTYWASIPQYEAWSCSPSGRRAGHLLPQGVYQYVPKRGEGFPDDTVPFKDFTEAVNPKYA